MTTKEQINYIKERGVYDLIANEYYKMSKEDIKALALEMMWQLEQHKGDWEEAQNALIDVLEEGEE